MQSILNPIRSSSGVVTVTVLTKPYPCPGRCVYCPTEALAPKSYLSTEPPVMRALQNDYNPFGQVQERLTALANTGHSTDKVELIVKGGTWSYYPAEYQREFVKRCLDAANEQAAADLEEAQRWNETAARRVIGLTVETRPDYVTASEIERLREFGVTRVELGVQTLEDAVLALTVRDHGTQEVRVATALLRDAGFKVAYHLMPNLPGATPASDLETFRQLFADPAYRPDAIKIYPCVVLESAELYRWWREGRYQPYDAQELLELMVQLKTLVPEYVRIERVVRDIETPSVIAGNRATNLRQMVQARLRERGLRCRCIRCREVREEAGGEFALVRRDYDAAGGREIFLSFEDPASDRGGTLHAAEEVPRRRGAAADRLAALLRLRIPSQAVPALPILERAALIRELHTYGRQVPLDVPRRGAGQAAQVSAVPDPEGNTSEFAQHRGLGRRLMQEAERIAREEFQLRRIAVIAGVGVREYYRKLGYILQDTYMLKEW